MSQSTRFDTLECCKRLQDAGFSRQQAEALVEEIAKIINGQLLTTKDRQITKSDISSLELIIKWMLGIAITQFIVFISFIKCIH